MNSVEKYSIRLMVVLVLIGTFIGAFTGCSFLSSNSKTKLLTSTSDAQVYVAQQQWQLTTGNKHFTFSVVAERSQDSWQLIILNSLGQRLVTASADGKQVKIVRHQSHPAVKLLPELLRAWQFSYWPLADLQNQNKDWQFLVVDGQREIRFSGILRATVSYEQSPNSWQGNLTYKAPDFQLFIRSKPLNIQNQLLK